MSRGHRASAAGGDRVDYGALPTEQRNRALRDLDTLDSPSLVELIHQQDREALEAVGRRGDTIAGCVDEVTAALRAGGRLIYVGAGTSGRLGALDAAECPPTFGTDPRRVVAAIAGGRRALYRAVEGAEDSRSDGRLAMRELAVDAEDVVCGISASGVTPYVRAALLEARRRRARTLLVSCATDDLVSDAADRVVALGLGAETIAGSTRMKSGLATKAVLHTLTTAAMIQLGHVHDNLMVDLRPTSRKLRRRAVRIVAALTGLKQPASGRLLTRAGDSPKVAAVMHHRRVSRAEARRLLREADGHLRAVLESHEP